MRAHIVGSVGTACAHSGGTLPFNCASASVLTHTSMPVPVTVRARCMQARKSPAALFCLYEVGGGEAITSLELVEIVLKC